MLGQGFSPVPHLFAKQGRDSELLVQPQLGDAVDLAQALGELVVAVAVQAALEGVDDLAAVQPQPARAAHGQDERPAEARVVVGIQLLQARELGGRAVGQARRALLVRALGRQRAADQGLAGQFGVGADQVALQ